jgi:hypothetical protein
MAAPKLVVARESFVGTLKGKEVLVHGGDRIAAGHPLAKAYPALFVPDEPTADIEPPPVRRRGRSKV